MSICRIEKNNNYTVMSNVHLKDKNLSLKAVGLLSKVLSLPSDWDYTVKGLCSICKEEERAIKSALKELKEYRYLIVNKIKPYQNNNFFSYEYIFYEIPFDDIVNQDVTTQDVTTQDVNVQSVGVHNVGVHNVGVQSVPTNKYTKPLNTNILNTNKYNGAFTEIINHLNAVLGTNYKPTTKKTKDLIQARLKENFTVDDFKTVIDKKHKQWRGTEMEKYLRPETLFGTKFEGYLNENTKSYDRNKVPDYGHDRDDFEDSL